MPTVAFAENSGAEAAGVHEELDGLPEDGKTQCEAAVGPTEVEVFESAGNGADAFDGRGFVGGVVAEAADGTGGEGFGAFTQTRTVHANG